MFESLGLLVSQMLIWTFYQQVAQYMLQDSTESSSTTILHLALSPLYSRLQMMEPTALAKPKRRWSLKPGISLPTTVPNGPNLTTQANGVCSLLPQRMKRSYCTWGLHQQQQNTGTGSHTYTCSELQIYTTYKGGKKKIATKISLGIDKCNFGRVKCFKMDFCFWTRILVQDVLLTKLHTKEISMLTLFCWDLKSIVV